MFKCVCEDGCNLKSDGANENKREVEMPEAVCFGSAGSQVPVKVPRIFVARVPQTITDEQFKAYWEDFGPVEVRR